ncbi:hypothetical protein CALVIDRAFT_538290 [Calocera viscosa TUFC12733]|uniref:Surp module n=1 Tax=Calocera viscosa (strain TUFC12733) TaxID=1330018 RepID=A0A167KYH1_CALVF|nr:hypothetical protein CALVIDRAFT_538290 [Calocera viscosa TUFC12733]
MADVLMSPAPPAPALAPNGVNGHADVPMEDAPKYATGMIYPPPDIRTIIDRTALHVARSQNPTQFEERVRESQRTDPKFAFLAPTDAYHAYYRHRVESIRAGEDVNAVTGAAVKPSPAADGEADAAAEPAKKPTGRHRAAPPEPPELEFVLPTPRVAPLELDTIKLTALFFAVRGAGFLQALSVREGQNPEFEFLRPTHPLFGYFSRLVGQYKTVLLPSQEGREKLRADAGTGGKGRLLEEARARADWERWKRDRERKRAEDQEAERKAFAEIDWHDYAVVQTIEFTLADSGAELPPPMSVQEIESMTLAQKRMAQMINESTTEEIKAANEAADLRNRAEVEENRAREEAHRVERAEMVAGVKRKAVEHLEEVDVDVVMDDTALLAQEEADRLRREMAQVQLPGGQMKIRENYVSKGINRGGKKATTTCTICGQQIPIDELEEHMRIELLDPRWKSQRDVLEARRAQANELQYGANVASSLKTLARTRVDIFGADEDEAARKVEEEAEKARAREREKIVWDGHTASKESTAGKFQSNINFEEQISAIHRSKGLGVMADSSVPSIGPALGPGITPASAALNAPALPEYANAVISAAPQPATAPVYGGPGASALQQPGFTPAPATPAGFAPPGMHPSRLAALSSTPGGSATPEATESEIPVSEQQPPAKRQRVERYDGHTYSEADWLAMHPEPISIQVQLPAVEDKPEWHFNGTVAEVPDLPLTLLVSTLRDRIIQLLDSTCPVGRIRLTFQGKTLTNAHTIANYNIEDGDVLYLTVRDMRKR